MERTLMCPKCGNLRWAEPEDHSCDICDYCNTKRIDVNEPIEDSQLDEESDRELFEQRIYRKYLYNNPQFEEKLFEKRIKSKEDFMKGVIERVSKLPKCPTCGSTNIRRISTGERALSVIGLGLFSGKLGKNYECLNCKARW